MDQMMNNSLRNEKPAEPEAGIGKKPVDSKIWQNAYAHFRSAQFARKEMANRTLSRVIRDQAIIAYSHHVDALIDVLTVLEDEVWSPFPLGPRSSKGSQV